MSNVPPPSSGGQRTRLSLPLSLSLSREDTATLRAALLDMSEALDDADAITRDMLRPPGERDLGPRLHAHNYQEAHRKMAEVITSLLRALDPPSPAQAPATH